MMAIHDVITSVGIDIGTSTTQLIFSKLKVENRASDYVAPRIEIIEKDVIYRSEIYFTPLISDTEIDADAIKTIVENEYKRANMTPDMVDSGAVIITGETARKSNANQVLNALSEAAGDFVVATAGPDLESVLSARGAGVDKMSEKTRSVMMNLDAGGGTTNIAAFDYGVLKGTCCVDIGGRLIKVKNGKITYIFHKIKKIAADAGILLEVGGTADPRQIRKVADIMADILAEAIGIKMKTSLSAGMYTNDGKELPELGRVTGITFSGGVADCIYNPAEPGTDPFKYGDIGIILGEAIRENKYFKEIEILQPAETIRATVVGAGVHTTEISGSTISFTDGQLPIKNVPILSVREEDEATIDQFIKAIEAQLPLYLTEKGIDDVVAIAFGGWEKRSFVDIQELADALIKAAQPIIAGPHPLIVVIENDIGKALGHALKIKLRGIKEDVVCIDGIKTVSGDYIDIGEPVCGGHVLPIVIKTLIFNS